MANKTITSANSIFYLSVAGIYSTPQRIQGFGTDAAFDVDAIASAEVLMGVDARMSVGWVPSVKLMTVTLQADSASIDVFNRWWETNENNREQFLATGQIALPSIGKKLTLNRGVLSNYKPIPAAGRTLQPSTFQITWESITGSNTSIGSIVSGIVGGL